MKLAYNLWYRYGTPPWVGGPRPELVDLVTDEHDLNGWPRGWAAYLMTRRSPAETDPGPDNHSTTSDDNER